MCSRQVALELVDGHRRQRDRAPAGGGLRRGDLEDAVHLAELLLDDHDSAFEVDVASLEAGELAPAETAVGGDEDERSVVVADGVGESRDLLGCGDLDLGRPLGRRLPSERHGLRGIISRSTAPPSRFLSSRYTLATVLAARPELAVQHRQPRLDLGRRERADLSVAEVGDDVHPQDVLVLVGGGPADGGQLGGRSSARPTRRW